MPRSFFLHEIAAEKIAKAVRAVEALPTDERNRTRRASLTGQQTPHAWVYCVSADPDVNFLYDAEWVEYDEPSGTWTTSDIGCYLRTGPIGGPPREGKVYFCKRSGQAEDGLPIYRPVTWTDSAVVPPAGFPFMGCSVETTTPFNLPPLGTTPLFTTVHFDKGGFVDPSDMSRLLIPQRGMYQCGVSVRWQAPTSVSTSKFGFYLIPGPSSSNRSVETYLRGGDFFLGHSFSNDIYQCLSGNTITVHEPTLVALTILDLSQPPPSLTRTITAVNLWIIRVSDRPYPAEP